MANWKYILKVSSDLRDAISNEKYEDILNYLEKAWREINKEFPDEYEEDEPIEDIADIENERDNLLNFESYDMDFEEVVENIDYLLNNLYDYCDNMRIWIEV
mgnify:CR=1 FL=1